MHRLLLFLARWFAPAKKYPKLPSRAARLGEVALNVALMQQGRGEWGSNNRGKDVEKFRTGLDGKRHGGNGPWCAAFVSWCLEQASKTTGTTAPRRSHSAKRLYRNCVAAGGIEVKVPRPGDIVLWHRGAENARTGHVGIVSHVEPDGGTFLAVEGNRGRYPAKVAEFSHELDEGGLLGFVRLS